MQSGWIRWVSHIFLIVSIQQNQILDYYNDILLMTAKWYSASLKARPIFNICPRFGRQPNISLELDPDIGSYLLWSQPGVCYLLLAVCFLLMNYSTALHPIKNFAKTLPELINEEAAAGMEISSPDLVFWRTRPDTTRQPLISRQIADQLDISEIWKRSSTLLSVTCCFASFSVDSFWYMVYLLCVVLYHYRLLYQLSSEKVIKW